MRVKIDTSPDSDIRVERDDEGNVVSIEFTPLFAGKNTQAVLCYGVAVSDQGEVLDRFSLLVSGANGKVAKKSRARAVKAFVDMTETERQQLGNKCEPAEEGNEGLIHEQ